MIRRLEKMPCACLSVKCASCFERWTHCAVCTWTHKGTVHVHALKDFVSFIFCAIEFTLHPHIHVDIIQYCYEFIWIAVKKYHGMKRSRLNSIINYGKFDMNTILFLALWYFQALLNPNGMSVRSQYKNILNVASNRKLSPYRNEKFPHLNVFVCWWT